MRFSILVPVYNVRKFLSFCVDSILSQNFDDYEIILVDDGSTDGSGSLCDEIAKKDSRIRVIHQENKGLLLARRTGIKAARGDFFIYVDSDDSLAPNALSTINQKLDESGADLLIYHADKWDGENFLPYRKPFKDKSALLTEDERKAYIHALLRREISKGIWTKAVSRDIVDIDRDYSELAIVNNGEDFLQTLPYITYAKNIFFLNEKLYRYRVNNDSLTHTFSWTMYDSLRCVNIEMEKYSYLWEEKGLIDDREHLVAYHYVKEVWEVIKRLISSDVKLSDEKVSGLIKKIENDAFFIRQWRCVNKSELSKLECIINYFIIKKKTICVIVACQGLRIIYRLKKGVEKWFQ